MELQLGPNYIDEPNLLYKLQRKIKVFNTGDSLSNRGYSLVASASKYGIVFIASPDGTLSVYELKQLIDKECEPRHTSIKLQEKPTHIAVNCDQELLAVTGGQLLYVYKIINFQHQNVAPSVSIRCDVNPSTFVSALQWNPCIPDTIAITFFDGTLLVSQVDTVQVKKIQSKARCLCWSPKGKQLVVGNSDGTLGQYKPDLTPMKVVAAPNIFEGAPVEALTIHWISTYQFAVVYKNATDNSRPAVTIVNTPKAGQPTCVNYEDICFSMGSNRPWYYYLQGLAQWNIILCSSSNSMEIATLGSADGANWLQWCQTDEARPELPLTDKKQENYPVGICIDTCAIHQLPWGENETLPHMPLLHVVSQTGLLTMFNIINLNRAAGQLCAPPQMLTLPADVLTSTIPGDVLSEASALTAAPVIQTKPQPVAQLQPLQPTPQIPVLSIPQVSQFASMNAAAKPVHQAPIAPSATIALTPQVTEQKQQIPATAYSSQLVESKPNSVQVTRPQPIAQTQELNAALKIEQERANKLKADQELKDMLVREVNDFQMELYKFIVNINNVRNKLQHDLEAIDPSFNLHNLDTEKLKKDCSLEDLRSTVVKLKLELVRACAVVAEAQTHAGTKDLQQWTQADPLTNMRVASVKKLSYYVQTQLEQAYRALDYKWSQMAIRDANHDKPGQRMIRPILDEVYQPLVKQQEILSRQQAVLRTLKNTLKECDVTPMFKSTSLLRSTPFRNKDPLSKLTKNILNMSIEPQNKTEKEQLLTPQKLDALRDMLSNHKTIKIKPINVELRQQLAAMRLSYEKSMKEKTTIESNKHQSPVEIKPPVIVQQIKPEPPVEFVKTKSTHNPVKQQPVPAPSFMPLNNVKPAIPGLANVARTLFTDEPTQEQIKTPQSQPQALIIPKQSPFGFAPPTSLAAPVNTRSVLKDMLQNKSQANNEVKNDANTFMGQKICSPTSFNFLPSPVMSSTSSVTFTSKPISDINNMFSKFQPQAFVPDPKTQTKSIINPKSDETGEPETDSAESNKPTNVQTKDNKPITNLFVMKSSAPQTTNVQNVADVLKSTTHNSKVDNKTSAKVDNKVAEIISEKTKENVPEKTTEFSQVAQKPTIEEKKENETKTLGAQITTKTSTASPPLSTNANINTISNTIQKPVDLTSENKTGTPTTKEQSESVTPSPSSIFAAAAVSVSKSQSIFGTPTTPTSPTIPVLDGIVTSKSETNTNQPVFGNATTSASASSLFATAVASQSSSIFSTSAAKPITQSSTIFSASPASLPSTTSSGSIFGSTATNIQSSSFATSTTQSSTTSTKPSVFSTPTAVSPTPVSPAPVFGKIQSNEATSTPSSVFTNTTTQSSVFGSQTTASVFGSTANTQAPVFADNNSTSTQSVFGATAVTTQTSVFGSNAATTTQSIFGTTTATTQASVFGTPATTHASVFGSTTSTTQPSVFGGSSTQASIFGKPTASTQASVFGTPTQTTQTSIFGSPPRTTQASVFGTPTQTTQSSVFGTPTQTTQTSVFGSPTQTTQSSIFGTSGQITQTSVFGTPTQTTQASVFGTSNQTTKPSLFGTPNATTAESGSLFGGAESNLFAAASISTTSAPSQTNAGNIFGGGSSGSVFGGGNTNVFGGKASFGQSNSSAAAIFGGGASFGQKPASNFWAGGNTSGTTAFGSSGFGQQTTQASSVFGGGAGGSFSSPSTPGQAFGTPQPASAFGSPQQQTAPAFGGSPVFGSKPVFGQSASFGSPSGGGFSSFNKSPGGGFGAPAAFGGAGFGGAAPGQGFGAAAPSFASPTQSNATFESLATQNTLTFGNLAQQSGQQQQPPPAFNTSPSFTGWRG